MKNPLKPLALIAATMLATLAVQAQEVDGLTPEQKQLLMNMLLKKAGALAPMQSPQAASAAALSQRSEADLASEFKQWPTLKELVQFERYRDGFAMNGRRYIDPEGTITSYGIDTQTGDFTYIAETSSGQYLLKSGRAMMSGDPVAFATAQKQGATWTVNTVTGKKFVGSRLIPSSRGFVLARDNTGFRYIPGSGTTNIVAPDEFTIAALQSGDIASTGYILLERTPASNDTKAGNALGSLFSRIKSLGSSVGIGKKEDYALFNMETNRLVPVNISIDEKQVQVMSECRKQNAFYARCSRVDSFDSLFEADGSKNMSYYFWRIYWFNVPGRPILVSQEGGLSKISATDLNSGKKVILFERALGIAGFTAKQDLAGKISVTAQMGFSSESRDDVAALLDTLPDVAVKAATQ